MKNKLLAAGLVAVFAMTSAVSADLLANGDFSVADTNTGYAAGWDAWGWGAGWSEHTVKDLPDGGNNTLLLNIGNSWEQGGGGAFQTVAAAAGTNYMLTVDSGADDWWQPTGQMEMIWLDSTGTNVLGSVLRRTVDGDAGVANDTLQPMQNYQLIGTAPAGTAFVKVEFSSRMPFQVGGSVTFDNAVLETTAIPEPATLGLIGLFGGGLLFIRRRFKI